MRAVLAYLALTGAAWAVDGYALPSGHEAQLQEWLIEEDTEVHRFRFVLPRLADLSGDFDQLGADLQYLCESVAVPALDGAAAQVVISVGEAETAFGVADPDVMQVFEAYRIEDGACIWEMF